jgi:hypothetical protein
MPDNIRQRFVNSASDRAAIWRGKSERFRQSFHRSAYRTKQTGIARQLQPQQQAAAQVPVALSGFASPRWMEDFHVKLNFSPALIRLQSKHLSCSDLRSAIRRKKLQPLLTCHEKLRPLATLFEEAKKRRRFRMLAEGHSQQPRRTDAKRRVLRPGLSFA